MTLAISSRRKDGWWDLREKEPAGGRQEGHGVQLVRRRAWRPLRVRWTQKRWKGQRTEVMRSGIAGGVAGRGKEQSEWRWSRQCAPGALGADAERTASPPRGTEPPKPGVEQGGQSPATRKVQGRSHTEGRAGPWGGRGSPEAAVGRTLPSLHGSGTSMEESQALQ